MKSIYLKILKIIIWLFKKNKVYYYISCVSNEKEEEIYFNINGKIHRDNDLPAKIQYYHDNLIAIEEWYNNGNQHRDNDLPALIRYYENSNGNKQHEYWYNNGKKHRENDLPAQISYYENGNKQHEYWFYNNKIHRDNDLPAVIFYDENGNIIEKIWYNNGEKHRYNGMAVTSYIRDIYKWYINGVDKTEEITQYIIDHKIQTNENGELINNIDKMLFKILWI